MWCLINKNSGKVISVETGGSFLDPVVSVIGFSTKKDLMEAIDDDINHDEVAKKVNFTP